MTLRDKHSYNAKEFFARVQTLSTTHRVPYRYFAFFLDMGELHLYYHLQGEPKWTPSDRWIKSSSHTLDKIESMLEEYKVYYTTQTSSGKSSEQKFIHWLFLIYLNRTPRFTPVPPPQPDLHAEVLKLLGSKVNVSRYPVREVLGQGHSDPTGD